MKKGNDRIKQILAWVLIVTLLFPMIPGNAIVAFAENISEEEYITDVSGLAVWENVWLKRSVTVTENVTVTGEVKMEPGVAVHVTAGKFVLESNASLQGDLYIEKSGIAEIWGTINGTVYVNSTDSSVQVEDWDGSLIRGRNFVMFPSSYAESVILNGVGTGYIDGTVGKLEIAENYDGDYGSEWNSVIHKLEYCGQADFYNCGHVYEAHVTGGLNFSNNAGAVIDRIVVSDGSFNNNGLVHFAVVEKSGRLYNNNNQDETYEEALIENVVVKENAEEIVIDGNIYRNFENYGNIGALIAYSGEICTVGDIEYAYADNCKLFVETAGSWRIDRGTDYQAEYLYAKDAEVFFQDWTDERTKMPKIRTARIENGQIYARDILAEELYIEGSFSGLYLERAEIYDLFIEGLELTEQTYVEVPTPEEVVITDFKASPDAQDAYELVTTELYERLSEEEQQLIKEFVFETKEPEYSEQEIEEKEFTKTLEQYDVLAFEFSSTSAISAVIAESPSGFEFMVMSKDDSVTESFMAYESGEYKFRVLGDDYGASLNLQVTKSATLSMDVYTQYASEQPENAEKENASLKDFRVSIVDLTENKEFLGFTIDGEQILFRENPKGHNYAITLSSIMMDWEFEPETVEITLEEGETKELEVVVKQYGDYFGYTADGTVPQVYFYDEAGKFVRSAGTDSYGNFWAGRLPSGNYTAILLRDDTGNYMFSDLENYTQFGFTEKEDYLKDTFRLEAGLNINYPDVQLPEAPNVENIYFDNNLTSVNTNRQTTVAGELVQVTLNYTFKEEYADKVSGLLFSFNMSDNTEFIAGSVTVNGEVVPNCTLEDGCLIVPAEGTSGSICYQFTSAQTDGTLLTTANAEFILNGKEVKQLIGMASVYITALTASVQTVTGNGKIFVTGYTSPETTVYILDNDTLIGETLSGISGYFSECVELDESIRKHKVCVAKEFETAREIRTEEQIVTFMESAIEVESFSMYYYVHGHSAEFHLTGEEFSSKRFIYDYWPGSVFTFEIKVSDSSQLDTMHVVSNKGSIKKLEAFYDSEKDIWVASGIFSEDENYAPADFDIEYTLKEITEKELEDADAMLESSIAGLADVVFDTMEITVEDGIYDEDTNSISSTVNYKLDELDMDYDADYTVSFNVAQDTPESLLEQGYSCINIDEFDVFYKNAFDVDTGKIVMDTVIFLTGVEAEEAALADELVLFGRAGELSDKIGEFKQTIEINTEDIFYDWLRNNVPEDKLPYRFIDYLDNRDIMQMPLKDFYEVLDKAKGLCDEVQDWEDKIKGKDANDARDKYNQKLDEIEAMLDGMLQAQMDGTAKDCGMVDLAPFYDNLQACRNSVNNIANSKWSFELVKKICTSSAGLAVSKLKHPVYDKNKKKIKEVKEVVDKCKDALGVDAFMETYMTPGQDYDSLGAFEKVTDALAKVQECKEFIENLKIDKLYGNKIDEMAGDTLEYWEDSNANSIKQLDDMVKRLKQGFDEEQGGASGGAASDAVNTGAGVDMPTYGAGGGNSGCFPPQDPKKKTVPGGGGDVNWDPSGYVYEGVPSNRLEGVTATTYYRGEDGSEVLWNAEEYGQINPQVTDAQGCYGWFVPEGEWKVVYEKDGYEIAETEWLPVPPPQTEVNIGLISKDAPEVKSFLVSPESAVITFSKYVKTDSVNEQMLSVKNMSGRVEAVNTEAGVDGTMLASKFRILFDSAATEGSSYTLTVNSGICGYNGINVPVAEVTATCVAVPESIMVEIPDYLSIGKESSIFVTLSATGGFSGMELECTTDEAFLEVISIGAVSEEGRAEVVVKAKKSGVSSLRISVAGTDVALEQEAVTAAEQDTGLMKYVERTKNKMVTETVEETENTSVVLWIVLAVLIVALGAGITVICVKKRRKTA